MHSFLFAYAFLGADNILFTALKKKGKRRGKRKKKVLRHRKRRQKFGYWHSVSGFISIASKRNKEPCNLLVSMTTMTQNQNLRREDSTEGNR